MEKTDKELVAWRVRQLTLAGFPRRQARELARDRRVDVHELLELVDRGCPPGLAVRIAAPLEAE